MHRARRSDAPPSARGSSAPIESQSVAPETKHTRALRPRSRRRYLVRVRARVRVRVRARVRVRVRV